MKTIKLLFGTMIATVLLFTSCEKEEDMTDYTSTIDITEYDWKLLEVRTNDSYYKNPSSDTRHILTFENDSMFFMNTTVNLAGGGYELITKGEISIFYNFITEMCCDSEMDDMLVSQFSNINTYKVLGNNLYFNGSNNLEIKFKQK
jgi:hypothetical protein